MTPGRKLDRPGRRVLLTLAEGLAKRLLDDRGQGDPLPCGPLLGFCKEMVVQADRRPHESKPCPVVINMSRRLGQVARKRQKQQAGGRAREGCSARYQRAFAPGDGAELSRNASGRPKSVCKERAFSRKNAIFSWGDKSFSLS